MTEIARPRRIPKAFVIATIAASAALTLTGCRSEQAPSETPRRGDDTVVRQFQALANKANGIFDNPPPGASHIQNEVLLDLPYTAIFDTQRGWELHLASYSKYDTTNPIPGNIRQVALFTGKDLPSINGDGTDASLSAAINSTSNSIGTNMETRGVALPDGTVPRLVATANSQNDPPAQKQLVTPKGEVICEETYTANTNQQVLDALSHALDAIRQGETPPAIALPQATFIGTPNAAGFCPQ